MKKKKWPTKVNVLGTEFKIKYLKRMHGNYGYTNTETKVIGIQKDLSDAEKEATLIHEIVHASLFISGLTFMLDSVMNDGSFEESIVRAVEHALTPLVRLKSLQDG